VVYSVLLVAAPVVVQTTMVGYSWGWGVGMQSPLVGPVVWVAEWVGLVALVGCAVMGCVYGFAIGPAVEWWAGVALFVGNCTQSWGGIAPFVV
jgi:hypothetical protein